MRHVEGQFGLPVQSPLMRRIAAACGMVVLICAYAAPVIRSGGYGGWVYALAACLLCPPVVCSVAGRGYFILGMLTNGAIVASFVIRDRWVDPSQRGYGIPLHEGIALTVLALVLSLPGTLVAAAIANDRRGARERARCAGCGASLPTRADRCSECGAAARSPSGTA